jgi:hypothetical protein
MQLGNGAGGNAQTLGRQGGELGVGWYSVWFSGWYSTAERGSLSSAIRIMACTYQARAWMVRQSTPMQRARAGGLGAGSGTERWQRGFS